MPVLERMVAAKSAIRFLSLHKTACTPLTYPKSPSKLPCCEPATEPMGICYNTCADISHDY